MSLEFGTSVRYIEEEGTGCHTGSRTAPKDTLHFPSKDTGKSLSSHPYDSLTPESTNVYPRLSQREDAEPTHHTSHTQTHIHTCIYGITRKFCTVTEPSIPPLVNRTETDGPPFVSRLLCAHPLRSRSDGRTAPPCSPIPLIKVVPPNLYPKPFPINTEMVWELLITCRDNETNTGYPSTDPWCGPVDSLYVSESGGFWTT